MLNSKLRRNSLNANHHHESRVIHRDLISNFEAERLTSFLIDGKDGLTLRFDFDRIKGGSQREPRAAE